MGVVCAGAYAGLTEIATAAIISRDGKVDYCFMSDAFKSLKHLTWLRKGTPLPAGTAMEERRTPRFRR